MQGSKKDISVVPDSFGFQERFPAVAVVSKKCGHLTLPEYFQAFHACEATPVQTPDDFIDVYCNYAQRLLGNRIASKLTNSLIQSPVVLTANHHCVDYHSLFVQGNILFGLALAFDQSFEPLPDRVVPILAFGSISLGNQVNPRGIILSREVTDSPERFPWKKTSVRVNIFPASMRRRLVFTTPPFTSRMIQSALDDTEKLFQERIIGKKERNIVVSLLNNEYLSKKVLGQKSYSDQAVLLNQKIWPKLFAEDIRPRLPKLVYLEMEQVVSELLQRDLRNPESLFYHVLFNEDLRNRVMDNLFGVYGCWDTELLSHCLNPDLKGRTRDELLAQRGTCFFWAVDLKGRHTRLMLTQESGQTYLKGIDHNGMMHRVPLTPEGICHGLNAKGLLPSLYTSFLVVALARGIKCFGGFWQADYLPCMQQKTVDALAECGYEKWARKVISVPTENYVTGMTVALAEYEDKTIRPAGCAEIIAGGGLLESDMAKIREITVEDANFFGQMEIYRDFCREAGAKADLGDFYNKARSDLIAQKMVRIRL